MPGYWCFVCIISYEEQLSLVKLRQVLEERLEDYNMEPKLVSMQLVLFKVRNLARHSPMLDYTDSRFVRHITYAVKFVNVKVG